MTVSTAALWVLNSTISRGITNTLSGGKLYLSVRTKILIILFRINEVNLKESKFYWLFMFISFLAEKKIVSLFDAS